MNEKTNVLIIWLVTQLILILICCDSQATTFYVDDDATGANDGSSWTDAYNYLQNALADAVSGDEIWVAEGTYKPDQGAGQTPGNQNATFQLVSGVKLFGGFPSGGGNWQQRDPDKFPTILSGDLNGDDTYSNLPGPGFWDWWMADICNALNSWCDGFDYDYSGIVDSLDYPFFWMLHSHYTDNSAHVVTGSWTSPNTLLDGFTVTAGCGSWPSNSGGGMYNLEDCLARISNCIFSNNMAVTSNGGGMYNGTNSSPSLVNCSFINNLATPDHDEFWDPEDDVFTFMEGHGAAMYNDTGSSPVLINCTFTNNAVYESGMGAVYNNGSNLELINCTFSENNKGMAFTKSIEIGEVPDVIWSDSGLYLAGSTLICTHSALNGIAGLIGGNSMITDFTSMTVDLRSQMVIAGDTLVNLADLTDPNLHGTIQCNGLLRVTDNAQIINANLDVTRARFEGDVDISNSVITAEAGSPYGQFFIEGTATIENNVIQADGDRYIDLDPPVFAGIIANNRIFVTITEGIGNIRGGLLELRGQDGWAGSTCDPNEFLCQVNPGTIPNFDPNTWMVEQLRVVEGAKVNLVNRFDFGNGGYNEVIYVKELILEPNSVLNTSFNKLYYDVDAIAESAIVKNEPLLGFSLNNIACDNDNDFTARIVNNNEHDRIHVELIRGLQPDPAGMMRMRNIELLRWIDEETSELVLYNARAKGKFARSNEEKILIWFEYLFDYDPMQIDRKDVELVIYLSEDPKLTSNRTEVARLKAPPEGRPGSTRSERFGTFRQFVNTHGLYFLRGTRIELELWGPNGTCLYINNFDPQVFCRDDYCSDVTGDTQVTVLDYLTVVGQYGNTAEVPVDSSSSRSCLDGIFSTNGYVDWQDLISWDWLVSQSETPHLCTIPMAGTSSGTPPSPPVNTSKLDSLPGQLLVAGKRPSPSNPAFLEDKLYVFNESGQYQASSRCVVNSANSRLIEETAGKYYQINLACGLTSITDANSLLPSARIEVASDPRYNLPVEVLVGLQGGGDNHVGRPVQDVAFDSAGDVYVTPVVVDPNGAAQDYQATAKLHLLPDQNPPYQLIRLYDDPPEDGENQERNALRELELSTDGYLYVLNAHSLNESSLLWVYDINDSYALFNPVELGDPNKTPYIPDPTSLHVSLDSAYLYLASSLNFPEATSVTLYKMSTSNFSVTEISISGMGHITGIAEDPATGDLWVSGFTMTNIPEYVNLYSSPFYHPYVAKVTPAETVESVISLSSDPAADNDLALPVSIQWVDAGGLDCEGADIDDSGGVGLGDVVRLCQAWMSSPGDGGWDQDCDLAEPLNYIDLKDFEVLGRNWLKSGCQ